MKQSKNKVNPKAGTLKQKNEKPLQNVFHKRIAFVLMLVLTLQTGMAGTLGGGMTTAPCFSSREKDSVSKMVHMVKLGLPSKESIRKADLEMNRNMYRSLRDSRIKPFEKAFERSDAEMNRLFMAENSISTPDVGTADEDMQNRFMAENVNSGQDPARSDMEMNAIFTAEVPGIGIRADHARTDEWMNAQFQAQNISLPSAEMIARADMEISDMMRNGNISLAANNQ